MRTYQRTNQIVKNEYGSLHVVISVVLGFGAIMFGLQIWLSGQIATAGELIQSYEVEKQQLLLEHSRLTTELNKYSSLERVQNQAQDMGFTKAQPQQIEYVHPVDFFAQSPLVKKF